MEFVNIDTSRIMYISMKYNTKQQVAGHNFVVVRLVTSSELA